MMTIEPITLCIEAEPHNRIARVHEALRDIGLELCGKCGIWKGKEHLIWIGVDMAGPGDSFTLVTCNTCVPLPLPLNQSENRGSRAFHDASTATPLAAAIREVAR